MTKVDPKKELYSYRARHGQFRVLDVPTGLTRRSPIGEHSRAPQEPAQRRRPTRVLPVCVGASSLRTGIGSL